MTNTICRPSPLKTGIIIALGCAGLSLGACVHIDDGNYDSDLQISDNTARAIQTCGEGNVLEVTEDGYKCKK